MPQTWLNITKQAYR